MTRLLRWRYVLPRVAALLLLALFAERGAALLLRIAAVRSGQAAVGAKVEIDACSASLLRAQAEFTGIAIADPRDPMTNLVEAERLTLDFDSAAALRKKGVVSRGELSGLRFSVPRETSGALPEDDAQQAAGGFSLPGLVGSKAAQDWLDGVQDRFTADIQLESVRLAKELRVKWPAEYEALEARARRLQSDIKAFGAQVKDARENPLRNVEFLRSAPSRLDSFKSEIAAIQQRLKTLPDELRADRDAVAVARRRDEAMLREKLAFSKMDANSVSTYLLGDQIAGPVSELIAWLRWARRLAPAGGAEQARGRGADVQFAGVKPTPDLLIRSLTLAGATRVSGRPLEFTGELKDFTTQPRLLRSPLRLTLATAGAAPMQLRAKLDRTGPVATDELIVDCPAISVPQLSLGRDDKLGMSVAPSTASLLVSLLITGEQLTGDLQLVQHDVQVTPHLKASFGGVLEDAALEQSLAKQLATTPRLVTTVTLKGSLDDPEWSVWSTAGPAVAEAMDGAVREVAADRVKRLMADGQQVVAAEMQVLGAQIDQLNNQISTALAGPTEALQALAGNLGGSPAVGGIGSRLPPMGSLFK